jgi:nucleoside-diphosphate-sugar epimerase
MERAPALLIGVGNVAKAVASRLVARTKVYGTTRDPLKMFELWESRLEPVIMPWPQPAIIEPVADEADVLVSFPPDGSTDAALAPACRGARSIVYISSTGVYGGKRGPIDDTTAPDADSPDTAARLHAEEIWRSVGATVLRAPGIYGRDFGLHVRLKNGSYSLPGDGSGIISRIHVDDLASFILAAFDQESTGQTYVVGDQKPSSQIEVVQWLCNRMQIPMPGHAALEDVSPTLRGSRSIDPTRALKELGVHLKYPTYLEGFQACLSEAPETETSNGHS